MGELFTIGHSVAKTEFIVDLLKKYGVQWLLDVRSVPFSKYAPQFNKDVFSNSLKSYDIRYQSMGRYFGARWTEKKLYTEEGYLDFDKVREHEGFVKYVDSVIRGLEQDNRIALMCTEKEPFDCHRAILVARGFELRSVPVSHILHDGTVKTQIELNQQLLDFYFPDRNQMDLFAEKAYEDEKDLLIKAYKKRNAEIGYRLEATYQEGVAV